MHVLQFGMSRRLCVAISLTALLLVAGCNETPVSNLVVADAPDVKPNLPYQVLQYADYVQATGCKVNRSVYNDSLQTALNYLVFRDDHLPDDELLSNSNSEVDYARRHSQGLFGGLLVAGEIAIPSICIHSSLARMGTDIGFPVGADSFLQSAWDEVAATPSRTMYPSDIAITEFEILSRPDYMRATACLASPATFHKYHLAFFQHVLGWRHEAGAAAAAGNMRAFLQELGGGRHTADGAFLDPVCLIPAVSTLASDLNLLNKDGQFPLE
jgi:hypothetical protein